MKTKLRYTSKEKKLFALYESIEETAIRELQNKKVVEFIPVSRPRNVLQTKRSLLNAAVGFGKPHKASLTEIWTLLKVDDPVHCQFIAKGIYPEVLKKEDVPFAKGFIGSVWKLISPDGYFLVLKETKRKVNFMTDIGYVKMNFSPKSGEIHALHKALGGSNFINSVFVSYAASDILSTTPRFNRLSIYLDSFVCNKLGYTVQEYATHGTLASYIDDLSKILTISEFDKTVVQLISDIFETLFILKKHSDFLHGDLKADNILISLDHQGKIITKLSDFDKSSITWRGVRFFNGACINDYKTEISPDLSKHAPFVDGSNQTIYLVPMDGYMAYMNTKAYMRSPIQFHLSYDYYILAISIASRSSIFQNLLKNDGNPSKFKLALKSMFPDPEQFDRIILPKFNEDVVITKDDGIPLHGAYASMIMLNNIPLFTQPNLSKWKI